MEMSKQLAVGIMIVWGLAILSALNAHAAAPEPEQQAQDRSFYLGQPVVQPEELSGIWEAPDGRGGAIGIHLTLDTAAPANAVTLVGTKQTWLDLQLGMYQRAGSVLKWGEENGFSDSLRGGGLRYNDGKLTLHDGPFDLDLRRNAGDKWVGRFHREGFDATVTLTRPARAAKGKNTWLLGTWSTVDGPSQTCIHIAETASGELIGWSDTLHALGSAHFAAHTAKPAYSLERYGELAKVNMAENGSAWIELNAYTAICCSHRFLASPARGASVINAEWGPGPNQAPHKGILNRMSGSTCIVPFL